MAPPDPADDSPSQLGESSPAQSFSHILIIEDDTQLAHLFADWIQRFYGDDTEVQITTTVADSRATLENIPVLDAVLLDRKLPDGDGEDLISKVRSEFDAITVIVTGTTPDSELVGLPVDDYLIKPIEEETLTKQLSLLEKLDTAGRLQDYSEARKASLLEYHLEEPELDPLFRRFANRWSYDRIEIAHIGEESVVYELYTGGAAGEKNGGEITISIVGSLVSSLDSLLANDEIAPAGELVPINDGYTWIDADGQSRIDTNPDSIAIYEFTCETPERHISDIDIADIDSYSGKIDYQEVKEILESEYN